FGEVGHAKLLLENFLKQQIKIDNIIGETNTATTYGDFFQRAGRIIRINVRQGIYKCRKVNVPPGHSNLLFRIANLNDKSVIAKFIDSFHYEAVPHDPPVNGLDIAVAKINGKMIYVIEEKGEI